MLLVQQLLGGTLQLFSTKFTSEFQFQYLKAIKFAL